MKWWFTMCIIPVSYASSGYDLIPSLEGGWIFFNTHNLYHIYWQNILIILQRNPILIKERNISKPLFSDSYKNTSSLYASVDISFILFGMLLIGPCPKCAQVFLLALCSVINPGRAEGTMSSPGN